jgi:hypothetical protein
MKIFQRIDVIGLLLVGATGGTWWLGEGGHGELAPWAMAVVLALAGFKGFLIANDYMELRCAPALWRRLVLGWLVLVIGLIALVSLLLPR